MNTGKWGTSFTDWQVQPLSGGAAQTLTLSAPSGVTTGYIYNNITVIGDLLSESGAVLYLLPHQQTVAAKILVKSGVQNAASYACSYAIEGAYSNEDAVAPFNIPFGFLTPETFMWRNRSTAGINYFNGSEIKSYTEPSPCNSTALMRFAERCRVWHFLGLLCRWFFGVTLAITGCGFPSRDSATDYYISTRLKKYRLQDEHLLL